MFQITIDGRKTQVAPETTVMQAARQVGIEIPNLCHHEALEAYATCRVCIVEVKVGNRVRVVTACNYPIQAEGTEVFTDSERIRKDRKIVVELLLARCWDSPILREFAAKLGVTDTPFEKESGEQCILCGLCVNVCKNLIKASAIGFEGRGPARIVSTPFHRLDEACIGCGACVYVCPTQCISMKDLPQHRVIDQWQGEYPLLECTSCGKKFGTAKQLKFLVDRLQYAREYVEKCPQCRFNETALQLGKLEEPAVRAAAGLG